MDHLLSKENLPNQAFGLKLVDRYGRLLSLLSNNINTTKLVHRVVSSVPPSAGLLLDLFPINCLLRRKVGAPTHEMASGQRKKAWLCRLFYYA